MPEFTLQPVSRDFPEGIAAEWQIVDRAQTADVKILVLSIRGSYPPGSEGSRHGRYIAQEAIAAVHATSPHCLVLDLRELDYSWGDTLFGVFQDVSQFMDADVPKGAPPFPILIVISERSNGLLSLVGGATSAVFYDVQDAIRRAIELGSQWQAWRLGWP
jgi:hypothetical protein